MSGLNPERWTKLWVEVTRLPPPAKLYDQLLAFYSESHRHYHNARHIEECLQEFDSSRPLASEPALVELAIWFHDAIYNPRATDNEERSAELAAGWLRLGGAAANVVEEVGQLVLATKNHHATLHPDAPLLVDIDLSIFGRASKRFFEYEQAIREEYAWVDQDVFATKRAEILQGFLNRDRIYNTDWFFRKYEQQARQNLRKSIATLRS